VRDGAVAAASAGSRAGSVEGAATVVAASGTETDWIVSATMGDEARQRANRVMATGEQG
jgi:hypothetical protein